MKVIHNARIHTLNSHQPVVSALAIERGRIVAVGGEELVQIFGSRAQKQNMHGKIILPGLTDAHIHLKMYALSLQKVDCETNSLALCLQRIAQAVKQAKPGEWILGHGWNQNMWTDSPPASPNRIASFGNAADLDAIAPNNPVYLTAKSLHAGWANSAALRAANINANTPDTHDGKLQRTADGQPTGILLETTMERINRVIPNPGVHEVAQAIKDAQPGFWKMGITSLHDFDRTTCFQALQTLQANHELQLRVLKSIPLKTLPHAIEAGLMSGFGNDWLRIGSVKLFMDGALGPRTAAMLEPYLNEPENRGILNMDANELFEIGKRAVKAGLSLAIHAIGDRANHEVLNAYERLRQYETRQNLPHLRHRIEHVQLIHPQDAARLAQLNIIASMQPIHAPSDRLMAEHYWGERTQWAYAPKTQLQHGAHLALGSDAPVESPNPFWGLHAAVTRQDEQGAPGSEGWHPEQRLSLSEALHGFTTGAAYAAGLESQAGKLAPGFFADLIVLEQDIFSMPTEQLRSIHPIATMIDGQWVWQAT